MPARLPAVLEAIYGAYAIDWQGVAGASVRESMSAEALYLATTLATLLGDEPEALGLVALIALSLSRANARAGGVPLDGQDPALWDTNLIDQGEAALRRAHAAHRIGRFQLEAAIQSAHCARRDGQPTDYATLRKLHAALLAVAPTLGAATAMYAGAPRFQPLWATRAHLLAQAGQRDKASAAYVKAISLTTDRVTRDALIMSAQLVAAQ